jgi:hypothetical protein
MRDATLDVKGEIERIATASAESAEFALSPRFIASAASPTMRLGWGCSIQSERTGPSERRATGLPLDLPNPTNGNMPPLRQLDCIYNFVTLLIWQHSDNAPNWALLHNHLQVNSGCKNRCSDQWPAATPPIQTVCGVILGTSHTGRADPSTYVAGRASQTLVAPSVPRRPGVYSVPIVFFDSRAC